MNITEGLYLHIPFCLSKCHYCSFCSIPVRPDSSLVADYVQALMIEIKRNAGDWCSEGVRTVYIGGGTPSMLPARQLAQLLDTLAGQVQRIEEQECTLEVNPGTLTPETLQVLRNSPVNRISLGIQSSHDGLLAKLGRIHTWNDARRSYDAAREAGFENISVDLIYGLPGQDRRDWRRTLAQVGALEPDHISAYSLQVEEGTPLCTWIDEGSMMLPDEEEEAIMFTETREILAGYGLRQYEISNFSRASKESRHNRIYWHNEPYRGMGAGSFSYRERTRSSQIMDPGQYVERISNGGSLRDWEETVSPEGEMEETMMMGLRMVSGISGEWFRKRFGADLQDVFAEPLRVLELEGLLNIREEGISPTLQGLRFNNRIGREFIGSIR